MPQRPATYICPPKTVQCGPEKHEAINNREAQKICGAPETAGPLALAQSAPLNPTLAIVQHNCRGILQFFKFGSLKRHFLHFEGTFEQNI